MMNDEQVEFGYALNRDRDSVKNQKEISSSMNKLNMCTFLRGEVNFERSSHMCRLLLVGVSLQRMFTVDTAKVTKLSHLWCRIERRNEPLESFFATAK